VPTSPTVFSAGTRFSRYSADPALTKTPCVLIIEPYRDNVRIPSAQCPQAAPTEVPVSPRRQTQAGCYIMHPARHSTATSHPVSSRTPSVSRQSEDAVRTVHPGWPVHVIRSHSSRAASRASADDNTTTASLAAPQSVLSPHATRWQRSGASRHSGARCSRPRHVVSLSETHDPLQPSPVAITKSAAPNVATLRARPERLAGVH